MSVHEIDRKKGWDSHDIKVSSNWNQVNRQALFRLTWLDCIPGQCEPDGKVETETVFVLSSRAPAQLGELAFAAALQAHWGIENALHYQPRPHLR